MLDGSISWSSLGVGNAQCDLGTNVVSLSGFRQAAALDLEWGQNRSPRSFQKMRLFLIDPPAHVPACRLTGIFDDEPALDPVILGMYRNGYVVIGDLDGAIVSHVFANTQADFKARRRILTTLTRRACVRLLS